MVLTQSLYFTRRPSGNVQRYTQRHSDEVGIHPKTAMDSRACAELVEAGMTFSKLQKRSDNLSLFDYHVKYSLGLPIPTTLLLLESLSLSLVLGLPKNQVV